MKSWKLFWVMVIAASIGSGFLTACGKKDETTSSSIGYGSLNSDGQTVTSKNSSVMGIPLDLTIQNITAYGGAATPYNYNMGYAGNSGSANFTVLINGAYQQVQAYLSNQWTQWLTAGQFQISASALCTDGSCSYVVVTLVIRVNSYATGYGMNTGYEQWKQIAIKKDMLHNRVVTLREFQASPNYYQSVDQLIRQL